MIDGLIDPDRVQANRLQVITQFPYDLAFVSYLTIGNQNDVLVTSIQGIIDFRELYHRPLQCRKNFRASVSKYLFQKLNSLFALNVGGRHQPLFKTQSCKNVVIESVNNETILLL